MYTLHIANKNYSSWSLRPWVLMTELGIAFNEVLHIFGDSADWQAYRQINSTGLVPCLVDNHTPIWDSLAIMEYLAEKHPEVWPSSVMARAWARCAAAEMHAGFLQLRNICSMSCGIRVKLHQIDPRLAQDIARIDALWQQGLTRFGGPFLAGEHFSAVDAFYAPVVFRIQTYGLQLGPASSDYVQQMLNVPAMALWYQQGLAEPYRDEPHDNDIATVGDVTDDFRSLR